jgi:hypothetical protein
MKKLLCLLLCMLLAGALCACTSSDTRQAPVTADENEFYISVVNGCADPLHGVVYEYYLGETLLGSGMCTEADGGYMERNEQLDHAFLREDFPDGASLSGFSIRFYVINSDSTQPCQGAPAVFSPSYGSVYTFRLTGSAEDGYTICRVD